MAAENVGLQMIKDELDDGKYAILSDATRSGAQKEVEAMVLRYLHNKCLYERTVGLVDISKNQTAQGIAIAIQEILSPIELNPSQCVGFSFDGASVISGAKGGVQAILKKYYRNARFVHCHSHRLNLVLQEVSSLCLKLTTVLLCVINCLFSSVIRNVCLYLSKNSLNTGQINNQSHKRR